MSPAVVPAITRGIGRRRPPDPMYPEVVSAESFGQHSLQRGFVRSQRLRAGRPRQTLGERRRQRDRMADQRFHDALELGRMRGRYHRPGSDVASGPQPCLRVEPAALV